MSYQLPDLLTLLISIASDGNDDDGDLHMNPSYRDFSDDVLTGPLGTPYLLKEPAPKKSRLQRTAHELLKEYNPGLLASIYIPFPSVLKNPFSQSTMKVATEWLSVCAIITEQTLRPHRITDFGDISSVVAEAEGELNGNSSHELWVSIVSPLAQLSYSSEEAIRDSIKEILKASSRPPPKAQRVFSQNLLTHATEYIEWRVALSGHRVLFGLFIPSEKHPQLHRSLELILEITICVNDIFAYNIHQAWHSKSSGDDDRGHLNLVSFLRAGDPEMTLQGAINAAGDLVRQRVAQLKTNLHALKHPSSSTNESTNETGGILASIFPSFFSSPSPSSNPTVIDTTTNDSNNNDSEIRRTLWNWVTGVIHWAYEVEYFAPDLEDDQQQQPRGRKKKGGEIRDYGWVFLIKEEDVVLL